MSGPAHAIAETYLPEDAVVRAARAQAVELGIVATPPGVCAALRLLAAAVNARAVVEIGTGTGVSGVWLLRGMRGDGILTTIDIEVEHQRVARQAFTAAGFAPGRTRAIAGRAREVLPRLSDRAYDLVYCDAAPAECVEYVSSAQRMLRSGGTLAINGAFLGGRLADPTARDAAATTLREVAKTLRTSEEWIPALLPVGDGLLCAVRA